MSEKIIISDADLQAMQENINKIDDIAKREELQKKLDELRANAEFVCSSNNGGQHYGQN